MKKSIFIAGLVVGATVVKNWRTLAKGSVKAGVWAGRKAKELSSQVMEDIEDWTAEANAELAEQEQEQDEPKQKENNGQ